jgi:hypothetical protein
MMEVEGGRGGSGEGEEEEVGTMRVTRPEERTTSAMYHGLPVPSMTRAPRMRYEVGEVVIDELGELGDGEAEVEGAVASGREVGDEADGSGGEPRERGRRTSGTDDIARPHHRVRGLDGSGWRTPPAYDGEIQRS